MIGRSIFEGIVLSVVTDTGPEIRANLSPLDESTAFSLGVQGMTLIGMGANQSPKGMFGPIPVPGIPEFKALVYLFTLKPSNTRDSRIEEHGRLCSVFLIFQEDRTRDIIRGSGLIQAYLEFNLNKIKGEEELDDDFAQMLNKKITDLLTRPRVRTIRIDGTQFHEFFDESRIPAGNNLLVIVEAKNEGYLLLIGEINPFVVRQVNNLANQLNLEYYRNRIRIKQITEFMEIEKILNKYNIKMF